MKVNTNKKQKRIGIAIFFVLCFLCGMLLTFCMKRISIQNDANQEITTEEITYTENAEEYKRTIEATTEQEIEVATETIEEVTTEAVPLVVEKDEFVRVKDYIPDIVVELKYATTDNFTGQIIYDFEDAYLRYGTVERLMKVQEELRNQGLSLKIWDAFRPVSAQFALWEVCPNSTYVANPNNGFSSHSKGNTIDITLVDQDGNELVMPTGFDDFSAVADRNYSDCSTEEAENAKLLEDIMTKYGFNGYYGEWWLSLIHI